MIKKLFNFFGINAIAYNLQEVIQDKLLGVRTSGLVNPDDFGADSEGCHAYLPVSYRSLKKILSYIPYPDEKVVLVDYGSGYGRVPIFAATHAYKKTVGVELSKQLNDVAIANLKKALPKLACKQVDLLVFDARKYAIPDDMNVFYFYMPFNSDILQTVLENIHLSVKSVPRDITVLYAYPTGQVIHLKAVQSKLPWLNIVHETAVSSTIQLMVAKIKT